MNEFHDKLNDRLWIRTINKTNREENYYLRPEVANKLKEIAKAFIESLEIPREAIKDIVITGSSASYNYTPHSDIDLHLLVDFDKVHKDCPIVGDLLLSKKSEFNNNHDITIYGIPVEVYAESIDNENIHNGLFSLKNMRWIDRPKKLKPVDNDVAVNAKFKEFKEAIENVGDGKVANELMQKIKRMRKAGLAKEGEFSVENQVFKKLRNEGLIEKLVRIKKDDIDKELSLEESYIRLIDKIEEMCTSTVAMAPNPISLAGEEQPSKVEKQGRKREKKAVLGYRYRKNWKSESMNIEETMLEIANLCEAILGRKEKTLKAAATSLPQREEKLNKLKELQNSLTQGSNYSQKAGIEKEMNKAEKRVNQAKTRLGFKPNAK